MAKILIAFMLIRQIFSSMVTLHRKELLSLLSMSHYKVGRENSPHNTKKRNEYHHYN